MIDLCGFIEKQVCTIISGWDEADIYAISFFVESNESYEYKGYSNVTEFHISYNTERDCKGLGEISEERWNYAFWRQNEIPIFETDNKNEWMDILFCWYKEQGISNIGYENYDMSYDNEMRYIGKGPIGYYELLLQITHVAKKIQDNGFIKRKFGKPIPIIIHDLEYSWYTIEATKVTNSNGEADMFFTAMKELGIIQ